MKKFIVLALLVITTACTQAATPTMVSGKMCEKCSCCQQMMKDGMQCSMMQGDKPCSCCQKMKDDASGKKPPASPKMKDHTVHH